MILLIDCFSEINFTFLPKFKFSKFVISMSLLFASLQYEARAAAEVMRSSAMPLCKDWNGDYTLLNSTLEKIKCKKPLFSRIINVE